MTSWEELEQQWDLVCVECGWAVIAGYDGADREKHLRYLWNEHVDLCHPERVPVPRTAWLERWEDRDWYEDWEEYC